MKRSVNYILAGILALLGFSSCSALREARQARLEREQEAAKAQQKALVEQVLADMEEKERPSREQERKELEEQELKRLDSIRRAELERTKLLYAVPNVPYQRIEDKK
ncbi:MAG: hypothetical protein K5849_05625 [Bacteroidales bacterium]|nr:hypothetical protein [Bacteroidales bacterium]